MTARIHCTFHCDHAGCERKMTGTLRLSISMLGGEVCEQRVDDGETWATSLFGARHWCPDHIADAHESAKPKEEKT